MLCWSELSAISIFIKLGRRYVFTDGNYPLTYQESIFYQEILVDFECANNIILFDENAEKTLTSDHLKKVCLRRVSLHINLRDCLRTGLRRRLSYW